MGKNPRPTWPCLHGQASVSLQRSSSEVCPYPQRTRRPRPETRDPGESKELGEVAASLTLSPVNPACIGPPRPALPCCPLCPPAVSFLCLSVRGEF